MHHLKAQPVRVIHDLEEMINHTTGVAFGLDGLFHQQDQEKNFPVCRWRTLSVFFFSFLSFFNH